MHLSVAIVLVGMLAVASAGLIGVNNGYNGGSNRNGGSNGSGGSNGNSEQEQGEEVDIYAGPPFPGTSFIGGGGSQGGKWIGGHGGRSLAGHRGSNGWQGSSGAFYGRNGGNEGIWHQKQGKGGLYYLPQ